MDYFHFFASPKRRETSRLLGVCVPSMANSVKVERSNYVQGLRG